MITCFDKIEPSKEANSYAKMKKIAFLNGIIYVIVKLKHNNGLKYPPDILLKL